MKPSRVSKSRRDCQFPKRCVPVPGDVRIGYKATCPCGKLVSVTLRGLYWRHKQARRAA